MAVLTEIDVASEPERYFPILNLPRVTVLNLIFKFYAEALVREYDLEGWVKSPHVPPDVLLRNYNEPTQYIAYVHQFVKFRYVSKAFECFVLNGYVDRFIFDACLHLFGRIHPNTGIRGMPTSVTNGKESIAKFFIRRMEMKDRASRRALQRRRAQLQDKFNRHRVLCKTLEQYPWYFDFLHQLLVERHDETARRGIVENYRNQIMRSYFEYQWYDNFNTEYERAIDQLEAEKEAKLDPSIEYCPLPADFIQSEPPSDDLYHDQRGSKRRRIEFENALPDYDYNEEERDSKRIRADIIVVDQ